MMKNIEIGDTTIYEGDQLEYLAHHPITRLDSKSPISFIESAYRKLPPETQSRIPGQTSREAATNICDNLSLLNQPKSSVKLHSVRVQEIRKYPNKIHPPEITLVDEETGDFVVLERHQLDTHFGKTLYTT
jgi:hypothetical protein